MSTTQGISRRQAIQSAALAAAAFATASSFPLGWAKAADGKTKKVLFFTRSAGYPHPVITRKSPGELSYAEKILVDLGKAHGFEVTATKDGSYFTPEKLAEFDVIAFYTTGLLDKPAQDPKIEKQEGSTPMPESGKQALLDFVAGGKGFIGFHCAADTFHGPKGGPADPYIKFLGGEFDGHNKQQSSKIHAVKGFAPVNDVDDFEMTEEWYRFKNIAPDMQVIFVQETPTMEEKVYKDRKPYPETWARAHGKGRVFYTSMGHREDVWTNPLFQQVLLGGLSWAAGNIEATVKPNLKEACPDCENVRQD